MPFRLGRQEQRLQQRSPHDSNRHSATSQERIQETKILFENPAGYEVFGVPNYWESPDKFIGLFIPVQYQDERYKEEDFEVTNELVKNVISLPMHTELEKEQQDLIINTILDFIQ